MFCVLYALNKYVNVALMLVTLLLCAGGGVIALQYGLQAREELFLNYYSMYLKTNLAYFTYMVGLTIGSVMIGFAVLGSIIASPI
jgi:hypothetical protein